MTASQSQNEYRLNIAAPPNLPVDVDQTGIDNVFVLRDKSEIHNVRGSRKHRVKWVGKWIGVSLRGNLNCKRSYVETRMSNQMFSPDTVVFIKRDSSYPKKH